MIKINPYPNELIYSVLARTKEQLGYIKNKTFMEEVLAFPRKNPSILFSDKYTNLQLKRMTTTIEENTLYNVFSSLLPNSDRKKAYTLLLNQDGNYYAYLHMPRKQPHFQYCPCCVQEHRNKYGETYWDKTWFIPNLTVCPIHHCYYQKLDLKPFNGYYLAEDMIDAETLHQEIPCVNEKLLHLTDTIYKTSQFIPFDSFNLKNILNKYLTNYKKGCILQIGQLFSDMYNYYDFDVEKESIHKIIMGKRWNFKDACYLLDFFNINLLEIDEKTSFSPTIEYNDNSDIYSKVAAELNVSADLVTNIANYLRKYSVSVKKGINYDRIDDNYLEKVRFTCEDLKSKKKRVTFRAIQIALNLPDQQLQKHLPRCRKVVEEYMLTNEQWRVEKVKNAIDYMQKNRIPFNITNLLKYAAMKKEYLIQTLPDLDEQRRSKIEKILN